MGVCVYQVIVTPEIHKESLEDLVCAAAEAKDERYCRKNKHTHTALCWFYVVCLHIRNCRVSIIES